MWGFITMLTRSFHRSQTSARWIQSTLCIPVSIRKILILASNLCLGLPNGLFTSGFPTRIFYTFLISHAYYMCYPFHSTWFDHPNIWWKIQVTQHLITVFSSLLSLLPLKLKYSPEHPCSQIPSICVCPLMCCTNFHIHTKHLQLVSRTLLESKQT